MQFYYGNEKDINDTLDVVQKAFRPVPTPTSIQWIEKVGNHHVAEYICCILKENMLFGLRFVSQKEMIMKEFSPSTLLMYEHLKKV